MFRRLPNAVQFVGQSFYCAGQFSNLALQFFDCVTVPLRIFYQQEKPPTHVKDILPHNYGLGGGECEAQTLKDGTSFCL